MDFDEESSRLSHGSNFVGAIFMCNRTTKKECLKRKLFGLPMSQAGFVSKVKTGMFLFLFEYERRQLYGVFEATTDGAINIAPEAYSKSGSSFPAQVHFESLWICHPLSENEFRDAIRENYFAPYKFNFGLSYIQVAKLVELFSSKKKSPMNHDVTVDTTESPSFPFRVLGASKPNFAETEALHIRTHPYPSYPDPETYSFNEVGVDVPNPTRSRSYDDYLPLEKERYLNFNYDPATFKEVDSARGMRYWKLMPSNPSLAVVDTEEEPYFSKGGATCLRRTSVFSRLSKVAAPKCVLAGDGDGSSPSDLLKMLYRRRSQWSKKRPFPFPRRNDEDDERLEKVDSMDPVDAELAGESGGVDEGMVEIPFIDFKRRSGEKNADDKGEGTVKRRKLIRPSFAESQVKEDMLLDLNSEATYLESNPNVSKSDIESVRERLDGRSETGTMLLDLNCEADLIESNASVADNYSGLPA